MDTRTIKKLIELVKETGIGELEVKSGEDSVRITCMPPANGQTQIAWPSMPPAEFQPRMAEPERRPAPAQEPPAVEKAAPAKGHTVKSPMVGTVYLAPTPGADPFVSMGQHVAIGETLCIIEAMKMFNKIEADKNGVISARMIENGQPVEYDQALFIIDTGE